MSNRNPKKGTMAAFGVLGAAILAGIYFVIYKGKELVLTNYKNVTTGKILEYPNVLDATAGDIVRVGMEYTYRGGAHDGVFHVAIWKAGGVDPHDEVSSVDVPFTVLGSTIGEVVSFNADLDTSSLSSGKYGLYAKAIRTEGEDIFSSYYADCINVIVEGEEPSNGNGTSYGLATPAFALVDGANPTYNIGDSVSYETSVLYHGPAQTGSLTLRIQRLGEEYTFPAKDIELEESSTWKRNSYTGSFVIPDGVTPGKTYTIYVIYNVAGEEESKETERAFTIAGEIETVTLNLVVEPSSSAGEISWSPDPLEQDGNTLIYEVGTKVTLTATPKTGYEFDIWYGDAVPGSTGTHESTFTTDELGVGTLAGDYTAKAKFVAIEVEELPDADIADWDFVVSGGTSHKVGDSVSWSASGNYKGMQQSGKITISLGTGVNPAFSTKYTFSSQSLTFPESYDWEGFNLSGSFIIPSTITTGQTYSVRAKIEALSDTTQETDTDYGAIYVEEEEEPEEPPDADIANYGFEITNTGPYQVGDKVTWMAYGVYKGMRQSGKITISLGTGVVGTFYTKYTFSAQSVTFSESYDWEEFFISGSFTIPSTIETDQTYSVRAKLEALTDTTQETDTDYGAVEVVSEVTEPTYTLTITGSPSYVGEVVVSPYKEAYEYLDVVQLTAQVKSAYSSQYEFDYWVKNGSTSSSNPTSVIITKDYTVVAYFKKI